MDDKNLNKVLRHTKSAINACLEKESVKPFISVKQLDLLQYRYGCLECKFQRLAPPPASPRLEHYQVAVQFQDPNRQLFYFYPVQVLATNRTCDTVISRRDLSGQSKTFRIWKDLQITRSLQGLWAGLIPYSMC